jgi:hypothetical protein
MGGVGGSKYLPAFELAINGVLLGHGLDGEDCAAHAFGERDLIADGNAVRDVVAAETVIGIGQNKPLLVVMSVQQWCQSSRPMKPSRGCRRPWPASRDRKLRGW